MAGWPVWYIKTLSSYKIRNLIVFYNRQGDCPNTLPSRSFLPLSLFANMLSRSNSSVHALSAILASFFFQEVATYGFIYPNANSVNSFHVGDVINVSWTSSFSKPSLQLFCGHRKTGEYIEDGLI